MKQRIKPAFPQKNSWSMDVIRAQAVATILYLVERLLQTRHFYGDLICLPAWWPTGITTLPCLISFPVCLSGPPVRHRAWMKHGMNLYVSSRSHLKKCGANRPCLIMCRHGWSTGHYVIFWLMLPATPIVQSSVLINSTRRIALQAAWAYLKCAPSKCRLMPA